MEKLKCLSKDCIKLLHKNRLLRPLIRAEAISHTLKDVDISAEIREKTINDYIKNLQLKDEVNLTDWLQSKHLTYKEFEEIVLNEVKLEAYCTNNFRNNIESRFLERKNKLDIVSYSLIRVSNYFKARELYLRLTEKSAEFGDLAIQFSEGIENQTRGIIGPYPLIKAHPKLANHLRNSKIGEVQSPIEVDKSYLVVRLESYQSAKLDDNMRRQMGLELFDKLIIDKVKYWDNKLLNQSFKTDSSLS